jgi:O-antigen/teichoic acid export membrane protein
MLTHRRLLTNAVVNTLGFVAQIAVSFVMAPITIAALGDERYGAWSFVESFLAYMLLFDLGVAASLVRFVPRFVTANDSQGLNRTYSACLIFFLGVAVLAALIGWPTLSVATGRWIHVPPELAPEIRLVVLVVVAHFALSLPLSIYPAMLDGLQAFVAKSLTRTLFLFLRIPALLLVFRTEARLLNMVFVLAATNLLESLVLAWLVYRSLPQLRFAPRQVDRATIRAVRGYSVDAFVAMMAGRLAFSTDAFVIGRWLNLAAIAHFRVANNVIDLAKTVLRSATTTLTPAVSASEAAGDMDAVRGYVVHGTRLSLYLVLPIQVGLFIFGRPFLALWLSPLYATAATPSMYILNITLGLTIAQSVASRVLYGMGRIRLFARITLLEGIVNVLVSAALVGLCGIEGAAWGTTVPHIASCLFVIREVGRLLELPSARYFARAWLAPSAAALLLPLVWLPVAAQIEIWTWATLVGAGLSGLLPYAIVVAILERRHWIHRTADRRAAPSTRDARDRRAA